MTSNSQTNLFDDSVVQDDMYYTGYFDEEDENDETIIIKQLGIRLVNVEDLRLGSNSASNFQLQGPGVVQKPFFTSYINTFEYNLHCLYFSTGG